MGRRGCLRSISTVRRSLLPATLCAAVALIAAGCSGGEQGTPQACLAPASDYLEALEAAPAAVTLADETAISDCLPPDQDVAELGQVGEAVVASATELNAAARRDPGSDDAVALGYLVGALQQGASESGGIHTDLLLRLDASARFAPEGKRLPVSFERTFGEGYAAGQEDG